MRAHIISKLIFKRLSKDNKIGFYNTHEKQSGVFGISANNKELTIEDLHYRVMPFKTNLKEDLEQKRSIWESTYAQAIDKIINSKDNKPNLSKEEQWNIARYFTIQGFLSNDNFENNYQNIKKEMLSNFNKLLKKNKKDNLIYQRLNSISEKRSKWKDLKSNFPSHYLM